jgi:hypothetical protein
LEVRLGRGGTGHVRQDSNRIWLGFNGAERVSGSKGERVQDFLQLPTSERPDGQAGNG